ncbi:MAG TPA: hypothetical protein VEO54_15975 [Thermoanaerobaculia bacterium]|nr:hypothetical protein [Thermoanaerobaculia bacterium]
MKRFVQLTLIGAAGTVIAINPQYVVQAQEYNAGQAGPHTTLKLVSGESVHVRGTLAEVLAQLTAEP